MRKPPLMPTAREHVIPCAVLTGADESLQRSCRSAVARAAAARLQCCSIEELATAAARWKPFALLVPEAVYEFDPAEFDALARSVGALLIRVNAACIDDEQAMDELVGALRFAYRGDAG